MRGGARSIADMKPGEVAVITDLQDEQLEAKLLEMGCLPGASVTFNFCAPLGDPVCIHVSGYDLSLRLDEASSISILS
jgi:ferrous iron transport protein A